MTAGRARTALGAALALVILYLVLAQPNHPGAMTWGVLAVFPLELPVLVLLLLAAGTGRAGRMLRFALVAALVLVAVLKTADFAMFSALSRGFNPVADLALAEAGLRLLAGAIGALTALLVIAGAVLAVATLAAALWWATGVLARLAPGRAALRRAAGIGALAFAGIAAAEIGTAMAGWKAPLDPPGAAFTARVAIERASLARRTLAELATFRAAAATDPFAASAGLLDLIDRDVLLIFVESYGRTSHDTPLYADLHRATLAEGEARLAASGLAMASGYLASPTYGGQSWLAHATVANGLWIDGQVRYGAILASRRQTLFHLAQRAGFRTAAVMPQITMDWPEADRMGFDTVLAAKDLGYRGQPFNWVTMPDQFTFAALDRLLRTGPRDRNLFVQVATGTSHAPWVPVPDLVPWEDLGDGRIFDAVAQSGDPPDVVWRDRDRVRAQYRLAVDYALRTVLAYAERHAGDPPLMIVLGDHQAAGFVALDERRDVPLHIIGPAHLVDRLRGDGMAEGLLPPADAPAPAMDGLRDRVLRAFSSAPAASDGPLTR